MIAAMYCTNRFAPCETESHTTPNLQQSNLLDWTLQVTDEHLGTMRLNELCAMWGEGRL
jgi:hypothetical protein